MTSSCDLAVDTPPTRDWVTFWAAESWVVSRLSSTSPLSAMSVFFSHQMTQRAIVPVTRATTTKTENQGIEIGTFGHIIEGPSKMDKEISKLRGGTARQLTMVNSRLNDGVSASGGEVQELVNAVNSTKDDLGRLAGRRAARGHAARADARRRRAAGPSRMRSGMMRRGSRAVRGAWMLSVDGVPSVAVIVRRYTATWS